MLTLPLIEWVALGRWLPWCHLLPSSTSSKVLKPSPLDCFISLGILVVVLGSITTLECQAPGKVFLIKVCSAALWDGVTQNIPSFMRQRGGVKKGRYLVWGHPTRSMLVFRTSSRKRETEKRNPGPLEEISLNQCRGYSIFFQISSSFLLPL